MGTGYTDRSKNHGEDETSEDDREIRLKALEKSLKEEEIDQETYERLRYQIHIRLPNLKLKRKMQELSQTKQQLALL